MSRDIARSVLGDRVVSPPPPSPNPGRTSTRASELVARERGKR
jgi:hypothetical protein